MHHHPSTTALFPISVFLASEKCNRPAFLRLSLRGPLACSSLSQLVSRFAAAAAPSLATTFRRPLRNVDQTPLLSTAPFSSRPELSALTAREVRQSRNYIWCSNFWIDLNHTNTKRYVKLCNNGRIAATRPTLLMVPSLVSPLWNPRRDEIG